MSIHNDDSQCEGDLTEEEARAFRDFYKYGMSLREIVVECLIEPNHLIDILGLEPQNTSDLELLYRRAKQAIRK